MWSLLISVVFILYLWSGTLLTNSIVNLEGKLTRIWAGSLTGIMAFVWSPIPFSFYSGFSKVSHFLGWVSYALLVLYVLLYFKKDVCLRAKNPFPIWLGVGVLVIVALIWSLLVTHYLYPSDKGWLVGQSTFGDLPLHVGIATSLVAQETFPPMYNILPGTKLSYPFLVNSFSASFLLFDLPLRISMLIPGFVLSALLVSGFFITLYDVFKKASIVLLAAIFFFFNGGLGVIYFFNFVYHSRYERKINPDKTHFNKNYPLVFKSGDIAIFAVSDRARRIINR